MIGLFRAFARATRVVKGVTSNAVVAFTASNTTNASFWVPELPKSETGNEKARGNSRAEPPGIMAATFTTPRVDAVATGRS